LNRCLSEEQKKQILVRNKLRGFAGLFASWDCKHFPWNNCPMRWARHHKGRAKGGKKKIIMEAIADCDRYLWYVNFGDPGSLNDLNILDKSLIVGALLNGSLDLKVPEYTINGTSCDWMYFLEDGIYPEWSIFVKTFSNSLNPDKQFFTSRQEAVRKDIECAFGVLV
jgi:hypothetical protein